MLAGLPLEQIRGVVWSQAQAHHLHTQGEVHPTVQVCVIHSFQSALCSHTLGTACDHRLLIHNACQMHLPTEIAGCVGVLQPLQKLALPLHPLHAESFASYDPKLSIFCRQSAFQPEQKTSFLAHTAAADATNACK